MPEMSIRESEVCAKCGVVLIRLEPMMSGAALVSVYCDCNEGRPKTARVDYSTIIGIGTLKVPENETRPEYSDVSQYRIQIFCSQQMYDSVGLAALDLRKKDT